MHLVCIFCSEGMEKFVSRNHIFQAISSRLPLVNRTRSSFAVSSCGRDTTFPRETYHGDSYLRSNTIKHHSDRLIRSFLEMKTKFHLQKN